METTTLWQYYNVKNVLNKLYKCNKCNFEIRWREMKLEDLLYCPHCGRLITSISNGKYYVMQNRLIRNIRYGDELDPD